jgi:hypothetical protein
VTFPTSVVPSTIDALVAQVVPYLPTGVRVFDGFGITEDAGVNVLMIGVDDADATNQAMSAEAFQKWANTGNLRREEDGFITCAAVCWDGDAVMKAARDGAYAIVSAVEQLCRTNPTLGIAGMITTSFGGRAILSQNQAEQGSIAVVIFRVNFVARL